jgi:hypothetical protein
VKEAGEVTNHHLWKPASLWTGGLRAKTHFTELKLREVRQSVHWQNAVGHIIRKVSKVWDCMVP